MRRVSGRPPGAARSWLLAALVVLVALGLTVGATAPARAAPATSAQAQPDFSLCCDSTNIGFVVRGGVEGCENCFGQEPLYFSCTFSGCGIWTGSFIIVDGLNGFTGTVTLEVLDLPPGVTSLTAASVKVTKKKTHVITPFALQATAGAALGDFTVTVRATSGGIVHTNTEPIRVVDALPPDGP